jgi:hypothetical protein
MSDAVAEAEGDERQNDTRQARIIHAAHVRLFERGWV